MRDDPDIYKFELRCYPHTTVYYAPRIGDLLMAAASYHVEARDVGYGGDWSCCLAWNVTLAALLGVAAARERAEVIREINAFISTVRIPAP